MLRRRDGDDETAFVAFALEITPALLAILRHLSSDQDEVEDLAAEAISRAFAHWGRLAGFDYRAAWVMRVATNLAHDRSRASARRRTGSQATSATPAPQVEATVVDRVLLVDALANLSRRQRQAIVLHHLADLSIEETAHAMGVTQGTARTHLNRGMVTLRGALGRDLWEVNHADS
jgi:RNA polymerase sigma-70 factor (ECF subfamily)